MIATSWTILLLCYFVTTASSQSNGMDMSMDGPMDLAVGNMFSYVHFTPGDTVWFLGWVPRSAGAMVGTCIGVFLLAMLERLLVACLALAEQHWVECESILALEKSDDVSSLPSSSNTKKSKWLQLPPFVSEIDITRGILFAAHAFVKVSLMLIAMTFQLAFLISIAVGSGVGETLFGRVSSSHEYQ